MANQYFLDRIAGRNPDLRAADADREQIGERLRKSHAEGRLDLAEFQERLECCYEAKTVGELDALVADLPRQDEYDDRRSLGRVLPRRLPLAPLAPILIVVIVISVTIGHHIFWLWLPLLFLCWRMSWWHRRGSWASTR